MKKMQEGDENEILIDQVDVSQRSQQNKSRQSKNNSVNMQNNDDAIDHFLD